MLYTAASSPPRGEGIELDFSPQPARQVVGPGLTVFRASVHDDVRMTRLVRVGDLHRGIDPKWTTRAVWEDGRIMARGPIPASLFVPWKGVPV